MGGSISLSRFLLGRHRPPSFIFSGNPFTRVIRRLLSTGWVLTALFSIVLAYPSSAAAEGIEITQAQLQPAEEGYKLAAAFSFELNRGLEDAIMRGIPLYFTTEVEIIRPRWYWFDERAIRTSQTIRLSYNVLTREYRAAITGNLQQAFSSLEDALSLVKRPSRWLVAPKGALKPGESYTVAVHMALDVAQLPKPFQVNALNNSDWRLSSDWKYFTFKAESR